MRMLKKLSLFFIVSLGFHGMSYAIKPNPATSVVAYTKGPNNNTVVYNLDNSGNLSILSTMTAINYNATGLLTNQGLCTDGTGNFTTTGSACGAGGGGGVSPGSTNYIQNTQTLQAGATFYVSSGTVTNQLNVGNGLVIGTVVYSTADQNSPLMIFSNSSSGNVFIGDGSGSTTSGSASTGFGFGTCGPAPSGGGNTCIGYLSLGNLLSGSQNTGTGNNALSSLSGGNNNTSYGSFSGGNFTWGPINGSGNSFFGTQTYSSSNTSNSTYLGYLAGSSTSTTLSNATAIGAHAIVTASNTIQMGGTGLNSVTVAMSSFTASSGTVGLFNIGTSIRWPDGTIQISSPTAGGSGGTTTLISSGVAFGATGNTITQDTATFNWSRSRVVSGSYNLNIGSNPYVDSGFNDQGEGINIFTRTAGQDILPLQVLNPWGGEFFPFVSAISTGVANLEGVNSAFFEIDHKPTPNSDVTFLNAQGNNSGRYYFNGITNTNFLTLTSTGSTFNTNVIVPSGKGINTSSMTLSGSGNLTVVEPDGVTYSLVGSSITPVVGHALVYSSSFTAVDGGAPAFLSSTNSWTGGNTFVQTSTFSSTVALTSLSNTVLAVNAAGVIISTTVSSSGTNLIPATNTWTGGNTFVSSVTITSTFTLTNVSSISFTNVSTFTIAGAYVDFSQSTMTVSSATFTNGIVGAVANLNAGSGIVGQYLSSTTASAISFGSTGTYGDLLSIVLTPGDWDVTGVLASIANGATVTTMAVGISTTTGNTTAGLNEGDSLVNGLGPTAATDTNSIVPNVRASLSSSTTYYLKFESAFSIATPQAKGRISARRVH